MYYFIVDNYINGDAEEYAAYIEQVKPMVESYGGRYLDRKPDRSIVICFPDREAIEKCFSSEPYRKIMEKRTNNVDSRAIIVPGTEEENKVTPNQN